ncbi:hypothetical protein [Lentilactobacillus kisonensis]|uniref:Uncharacterized protein n=1 Tax=Lentilactobacillus kisonensis DSM 19906 = JCM 15041 TaxID=1423766 RepID=A0A0R1P0R3_9LACO|nr:hypothetical protein [Lentilactobacillus kisonensis]KRL22216.1 hypothetical protein FC98_GL002595 [Lentilactobacillus kisonensis DSM 19906 = JCM 15041]
MALLVWTAKKYEELSAPRFNALGRLLMLGSRVLLMIVFNQLMAIGKQMRPFRALK